MITSSIPKFVRQMDRLSLIRTKSAAEHCVLLAAIRWVNEEGLLWPSIPNWAAQAGVDQRTVQRALASLVARGVVVVDKLHSGRSTTRYRILCMDLTNPGIVPGLDRPEGGNTPPQPRRMATPTTASGHSTPGTTPPHQQLEVPPQEHPTQQLSPQLTLLLAPQLRNHQNATPERLTWIEREAPSKDNPQAWAAACILKGWNPPADAASIKEQERAQRARRLAEFDALPEDEQMTIVSEARRRFPGMGNLSDNDATFRSSGIGWVLKAREESYVASRQRTE